MRRAGYTSAPCHGCGSTALHLKDSVCQTCAKNLRMYADIVASQAESSDKVPLIMQERHYALPYMPHQLEEEGERRTIQHALHELSMLLSEPSSVYLYGYDNERRCVIEEHYLWDFSMWSSERRQEWAVTRMINPVVAKILRKLQVVIHKSLEHAHAEGARTGRSLLMGLASGEITSDEFNDRAARLDKDGQR